MTSRLSTQIARQLVDEHVRAAERRRRPAGGRPDVRARAASTTSVRRRVRSLAGLVQRPA